MLSQGFSVVSTTSLTIIRLTKSSQTVNLCIAHKVTFRPDRKSCVKFTMPQQELCNRAQVGKMAAA